MFLTVSTCLVLCSIPQQKVASAHPHLPSQPANKHHEVAFLSHGGGVLEEGTPVTHIPSLKHLRQTVFSALGCQSYVATFSLCPLVFPLTVVVVPVVGHALQSLETPDEIVDAILVNGACGLDGIFIHEGVRGPDGIDGGGFDSAGTGRNGCTGGHGIGGGGSGGTTGDGIGRGGGIARSYIAGRNGIGGDRATKLV